VNNLCSSCSNGEPGNLCKDCESILEEKIHRRKQLNKIALGVLIVPLIFLVQVVVMMYGWGLAAENWWVITGGFLIGFIFSVIGELIKL